VRHCPLFFLSSGRRHTRFSRDWSSDVCSSDLSLPPPLVTRLGYVTLHRLCAIGHKSSLVIHLIGYTMGARDLFTARERTCQQAREAEVDGLRRMSAKSS